MDIDKPSCWKVHVLRFLSFTVPLLGIIPICRPFEIVASKLRLQKNISKEPHSLLEIESLFPPFCLANKAKKLDAKIFRVDSAHSSRSFFHALP